MPIEKPAVKIITTKVPSPLQRADLTKVKNPNPKPSAPPRAKPNIPIPKIEIPKELPTEEVLKTEQDTLKEIIEEGATTEKPVENTPSEEILTPEETRAAGQEIDFLASSQSTRFSLPVIRIPPAKKSSSSNPDIPPKIVEAPKPEPIKTLITPTSVIFLNHNIKQHIDYRVQYKDAPVISEHPTIAHIFGVPREDPLFQAILQEHSEEPQTRDSEIVISSPFAFMSRTEFQKSFRAYLKGKSITLSYSVPQYSQKGILHQIYFSSGTVILFERPMFVILDVKLLADNMHEITNVLQKTDSLSRVEVSEILLGSLNLLFK